MDGKEITREQIEKFLLVVDKCFPVPLSEKTDLSEYAEKLREKATICAVRGKNGNILSMVAGYTENMVNEIAYISMAATLPQYQGRGYGKKLVKEFMNIAQENRMRGVHLYAVESNKPAMKMYEYLGFEKWYLTNEPRPDDVHLIYKFKIIP